MSKKKGQHNLGSDLELLKNEALVQQCFKQWQMQDSSLAFYVVDHYKTYWCVVDAVKLKHGDTTDRSAVKLANFTKHISLSEIANCAITILYSQVESGTEECIYYLEIAQSTSKKAKSAFTAKQLSGKSDFKQKVMATLSGAIYTGNTEQLNSIFLDQAPQAKIVKTIPYIGYFSEINAYIYTDHAVYEGNIYQKNTDDFFVLPHCYVKSTFELSNFTPNTEY